MNSILILNDTDTFEYRLVTNRSNYTTEFYGDDDEFDNYLQFRFTLSWMSLILILFGVFSNIVSTILLNKSQSSTNIYLSGVCVSSIITLFGFFINYVLYNMFIHYKFIFGIRLLMIMYPFVYPMITTAQISFVLLTVSVSLNQYVIVSRKTEINPSKKAIQKECKKAYVYKLLVYFFSLVYCSPYWLMFKYDKDKGLEQTELNRNTYFRKIVHFCMYIPIAFVVPFTILVSTNIYLIMTLKIRYENRKKLNSTCQNKSIKITRKREASIPSKETSKSTEFANFKENCETLRPIPSSDYGTNRTNESHSKNHFNLSNINFGFHLNRRNSDYELQAINSKAPLPNISLQHTKNKNKNVTIMLIAVVTFFLICQTPSLILNVNEALKVEGNSESSEETNPTTHVYGIEFAKFFLIINSSFNSAIFYFFNKKFRNDLKSIFSLDKLKKKENRTVKK